MLLHCTVSDSAEATLALTKTTLSFQEIFCTVIVHAKPASVMSCQQ
jgi:hypothetical protein